MKEYDFASLGLSYRETIKKWTHTYEVRAELYDLARKDLIASFCTTTRTSDGLQILNTTSQFNQHHYLNREQISIITEWLRDCTIAARWRLTTYTMLVEAHP